MLFWTSALEDLSHPPLGSPPCGIIQVLLSRNSRIQFVHSNSRKPLEGYYGQRASRMNAQREIFID